MTEIEIKTFTEFHNVIEKYDARTTVYSKDIPNRIRSTVKKTINKYGVDRFALFLGLESLAAHIGWLQSKG